MTRVLRLIRARFRSSGNDADLLNDDELVDLFLEHTWRLGIALLMGSLFFLDIIIMDVRWQKAMLVSWIVIACVYARLGIWVTRKVAIVLTAYAIGYLIGALPPIGTVGTYLTRLLA